MDNTVGQIKVKFGTSQQISDLPTESLYNFYGVLVN